MKYVLDASAAICWVVRRPLTPKAIRLRDDFRQSIHHLLAPDIFIDEVASGLTKAERQKLIPVGQAASLYAQVMKEPVALHSCHRHLLTNPERLLRLPLRSSGGARGVSTDHGRPEVSQ